MCKKHVLRALTAGVGPHQYLLCEQHDLSPAAVAAGSRTQFHFQDPMHFQILLFMLGIFSQGFAQPAQAKAVHEKIQGSELHIFPGVCHQRAVHSVLLTARHQVCECAHQP